MTKQYKYEEYEKLSDVVRDWENGEKIYRETMKGVWSEHCGSFHKPAKYAKRVEIKEETSAFEIIHHMGSFKGEALMINVSDDFMQKFKDGAIKIKSASITWIEISGE